jgi:hypothetical protein
VVQSSALVEGGYTAVSVLDATDGSDYHYGVTPQALANLRLIAWRRAAEAIRLQPNVRTAGR